MTPEPEPELIEIEKHYCKHTRNNLPVEVVAYDLPEAGRVCPDCGVLYAMECES